VCLSGNREQKTSPELKTVKVGSYDYAYPRDGHRGSHIFFREALKVDEIDVLAFRYWNFLQRMHTNYIILFSLITEARYKKDRPDLLFRAALTEQIFR
jgi:hypothetical protein